MEGVGVLSDEAIIESVLGGNREAYAGLVERHHARLFGLAFHLCGDYDTAMDLTQETLIAGFNCLDRIRDPRAFAGWIAAILRNKFRSLARAAKNRALSLDLLMEAGFDPPSAAGDAPPSDEDLEKVAMWVRDLPEPSREVLLLRYSDDLSYKEIAGILGVPVSTVTMRLTHARRSLVEMAKKGGLLK